MMGSCTDPIGTTPAGDLPERLRATCDTGADPELIYDAADEIDRLTRLLNLQQQIYERELSQAQPLAAVEAERQRCQPSGLMFDALGEPRTRHVRVTLDGSHCVMTPVDGDRYVQDARGAGDESEYEVADVYLSEREFEDLPEHDGF